MKQLFEPSVEITTSQPFLYQGQQSDQFSNTQSLGSVHPASHVNTANQQYGRPQPQAHGLTSASSPYPVTSATVRIYQLKRMTQANIYFFFITDSFSCSSQHLYQPRSKFSFLQLS